MNPSEASSQEPEEPVEIVSARGQEIPVLDRIDADRCG